MEGLQFLVNTHLYRFYALISGFNNHGEVPFIAFVKDAKFVQLVHIISQVIIFL